MESEVSTAGKRGRIVLASFIAAIVAGLLVVTPVSWVGSEALKTASIAILLSVSVIALLLDLVESYRHEWRRSPILVYGSIAAISLLPVIYAVSWFVNGRNMGFADSISVDTLMFAMFFAAAFAFSTIMIRSEKHVGILLRALLGAICIAAIYQYVAVILHISFIPGSGNNIATALVGKWNELSLFLAFGSFILIAGIIPMRTRVMVISQMVALALLTAFLFVINFVFAWYILLAGAVLSLAVEMLIKRGRLGVSGDISKEEKYSIKVRRFATSAVAVASLLGIMYGGAINAGLPAPLIVPTMDVRPSLSSTYALGQAAHGNSIGLAILGSGPDSFQHAWVMHKPLDVNLTQFWSAEFVSGFSNISTAFVSTGWLGVIGWSIPLFVSCIAISMLLRRRRNLSANVLRTGLVLSVLSLTSWMVTLLYVPGITLTLLSSILAGSLVGYVAFMHGGSERKIEKIGKMIVLFGYAVLAVIFVGVSLITMRYMLSSFYAGQATDALSAGNVSTAMSLNKVSLQVQPTDVNLRLAMSIDYALLQRLASTSTTPVTIDQVRQEFQNVFKDAIARGYQAAELNPTDYKPYVNLAQMYEFLVALKVAQADTEAAKMYTRAATLNPTNPVIPLMLARLQATVNLHGNLSAVKEALTSAITLKKNYTEAFVLAEKISVSLDDIPSAINAAQAAVQSAQDQPSLWFELGLLYYASGRIADAAQVFEQAVKIAPQQKYANAQYFLGMSYYKLGRTNDATAMFNDIAQGNPNSTEVQDILKNIKLGKDPFPKTPAVR